MSYYLFIPYVDKALGKGGQKVTKGPCVSDKSKVCSSVAVGLVKI